MFKGLDKVARAAVFVLVVVFAVGWLGVGEAQAVECNESVPGFSECAPPPTSTNLDQPKDGENGWAVRAFDFSMGVSSSTCYFCTFSQDFLLALASFSAAVFDYLRGFFVRFMPLVFALWLAVKVVVFFATGSKDGEAVVRAFVFKCALFILMWLVMLPSGAPSSSDPAMTPLKADAPWTWVGPEPLQMGFQLFGDVRTAAITNLSVNGASVRDKIGFNCRGSARGNATMEANPGPLAFGFYATEGVCTIERTHFMAIAVGLSMITASFSDVDIGFDVLIQLFQAIFISVFGLILVGMAALAMVWFAFHLLEVVVKFLFIAALLPILVLFGFLEKTRSYMFAALRQLVGAMGSLFGLAVSTSLSFYLIANTVNVYNISYVVFDPSLIAITPVDVFSDIREFVRRVGLDSSNPMRIPMSIASPWYIYLLLVMYSNQALGKKITSIVEGITGARALSEMADTAKRMAVVGGLMAGGGAVVGAKLAGSATVGTGKAGFWSYDKFRDGFRGAQGGAAKADGVNLAASLNPFGAAANAVRSSLKAGRNASSAAGQALNAADSNPPPQ